MEKQSGTLWLIGLYRYTNKKIDSIRCTTYPSHTECQTRGIDLIFVLDSSGSVGSSNFRNVRIFVSNLVSQLEIGPDNTQVGLG